MQSNHITPPAEMSSTQPVSQHSYILSALQGPMARPKFSTTINNLHVTVHADAPDGRRTEALTRPLDRRTLIFRFEQPRLGRNEGGLLWGSIL